MVHQDLVEEQEVEQIMVLEEQDISLEEELEHMEDQEALMVEAVAEVCH